ncbi:MAG: hypothetical protein MJ236_04370, partial [Clostridia bacterium]|nr:hypothetical protein [Clostridia bacterium]
GDYYLLKKSIGDEFDFELYNKLIRDSGLTDFVEMIDKVIDSIFNESSIDEEIILYIYKSSMYGSNRLRIKNGIKKYGRFKYMLRLFFLPYRSMAQNYHVLKYLPFLLPVMWLVRFVRFCFRGQSSLSTIKSLID